MNQNNFDDIIKQKADGHEAPVPKDAWDNIAKKKRRKPFPVFWWWLSSLLIIIAIFTTVTLYRNTKKDVAFSRPKAKVGNAVNKSATEGDSTVILPLQANSYGNNGKDNNKNQSDGNKSILTINDRNQQDHIVNNDVQELTDRSSIPDYPTNGSAKQSINRTSKNTLVKRNKKMSADKAGSVRYLIKNADAEEDDAVDISENKLIHNKEYADKKNKDDVTNSDNNLIALKETIITNPSTGTGNSFLKDSLQKNAVDSTALAKKTNEKEGKKKDSSKNNKVSSLSIELSAMPVFALQNYNSDLALKRVTSNGNYREEFASNYIHTSINPSVAFSLAVSKKINSRFSIGTGIQYLQLKEKISMSGNETHTTYTEVDRLVNGNLIKDTIETVTKGIRTIEALNSYKVFSIPLFIRYALVNKKSWGLDMNAGMYLNISSDYHNSINGHFESADTSVIQQAGNKTSTGVDIMAGFHLSRTINKKWIIFAEPTIRLNLKDYQLQHSFITKKIHQAGISFGIAYTIK